MIEFKLQLEENLVQTLGEQEIKHYLQDFVQKMTLKSAAQEILNDLPKNNLMNDPKWQLARNLAWEQEKSKYLK